MAGWRMGVGLAKHASVGAGGRGRCGRRTWVIEAYDRDDRRQFSSGELVGGGGV
jgi:hypothetical protein